MRVAIIGAGNVGGTLGTAWAQKAGHEIFFGVRTPTSDQTQASRRSVQSFREKWANRENSGLSAPLSKCRALTSAEPKTGRAFNAA